MDETPTEPEGATDAEPGPEAAAQTSRPRRRLFRKRARDEGDGVRAAAEPAAESDVDGAAEEPSPEGEPESTQPAALRQGKAPGRNRIKRDRQRLDSERQEAQFHLGGLAVELFRRDALTEQVLRSKAAELIDLDEQVRLLDWRLEAIETERRQRKGMEPPVAGACLSCGAEFAPAAAFCWRCGVRFAPETHAQSALTMEIGTTEE